MKRYDHLELGQFIPIQYHYNMLNDKARMQGFKTALQAVVKPGSTVLELGGGTGVLSFFAAQQAGKVYCVERNPELLSAARRILKQNDNGDKVQVIHADAAMYLPPEPVDVVICEMLHVGLLREKQIDILRKFKQGYQRRFGSQLPVFVPEACIQAIQPIEQDYDFEGYYAPTVLFQEPTQTQNKSRELAPPTVFQSFTYDQELPQECQFNGELMIEQDGELNAIRMVTKNVLAILLNSANTVDWFNQYLIVPLDQPMQVKAGDRLAISFCYEPGAPLDALNDSLQISSIEQQSIALAASVG